MYLFLLLLKEDHMIRAQFRHLVTYFAYSAFVRISDKNITSQIGLKHMSTAVVKRSSFHLQFLTILKTKLLRVIGLKHVMGIVVRTSHWSKEAARNFTTSSFLCRVNNRPCIDDDSSAKESAACHLFLM